MSHLCYIEIMLFQVGRIMDSALDHVNERLTKKERKRTIVDELLADAEFQKYNKKKYKEIIDEKRKSEYRTFMRDKRQKNKAELKKNKLKSKKQVQSQLINHFYNILEFYNETNSLENIHKYFLFNVFDNDFEIQYVISKIDFIQNYLHGQEKDSCPL